MNFGIVLKSLSLKNFATFKDEVIHFSPGFNAITGETGSGKSLVFDALQFIFGHRADRKFIRKEAEISIIEALFQSQDKSIKKYLSGMGYPYEGDLISIKRILYQNGTSKTYLNFQLAPLSAIQKFSKRFIDFTGQFENQKILSSGYQMRLLDKYSSCEQLVESYWQCFQKIQGCQASLGELNEKNQNRDQRIDYIEFQIQEIEKLDPSPERERELIEQKEKLKKYRDSFDTILSLNSMISDHDTGILGKLFTANKIIQDYQDIFSKEAVEKAMMISSLMEDLSFEVSKQQEEMDWEEEEFDSILNELSRYQKLKRKWGASTESILASYQSLKKEQAELHHIAEKILEVEKLLEELTREATKIAETLHLKRRDGAALLSKELSLKIRKLNMDHASIDLQCSRLTELSPNGLTELKFLAQTNLGEDFSEIKKIASGGELSRILLSVRQAVSSKDSASIFFFDEIASGIGGQTALTVAQALKAVASHSQVIAITHLPQIAMLADKLLAVEKEVQGNRTHSLVSEYTGGKIKSSVRSMSPLS